MTAPRHLARPQLSSHSPAALGLRRYQRPKHANKSAAHYLLGVIAPLPVRYPSHTVRRLFSTFASGAPGAGLLLLRIAGATIFIVTAADAPWRIAESPALLLQAISLALGLLLVAGVWTPVVATLAAVAALAQGCWHPTSARYWLVAAICAALALLGPGAWSIDARLFGWKRIDIDTEDR
jgi:putative oxidoreductase